MLRINVDCENDAFQGDSAGETDLVREVARILRDAADRIERDGCVSGLILHDINGNRVGEIAWEDEA